MQHICNANMTNNMVTGGPVTVIFNSNILGTVIVIEGTVFLFQWGQKYTGNGYSYRGNSSFYFSGDSNILGTVIVIEGTVFFISVGTEIYWERL